MDGWDWVVYFLLLAFWIRSYVRTNKLVKTLNDEGREFGSFGYGIFAVLLFPWAIRQAEKSYVREQENNRQSAE